MDICTIVNTEICDKCGQALGDHGWIEGEPPEGFVDVSGGYLACPKVRGEEQKCLVDGVLGDCVVQGIERDKNWGAFHARDVLKGFAEKADHLTDANLRKALKYQWDYIKENADKCYQVQSFQRCDGCRIVWGDKAVGEKL